MPIAPTYPGVYVQEVPSGVRTIVGVSTSTTLFIGSSQDGPLDSPQLCLNYSDFATTFSEDTSTSDLARYVKLFFLNGGTMCYVMRIANGARQATVTLKTEANADSLKLTAKNWGDRGNAVRAAVTYDTDQPEATFNMQLFRWDTDSSGRQVQAATEVLRNLSMNPASASYAPTVLTQNSSLVDAAVTALPTASTAFSQSGRPFDVAAATFGATWDGIAAAKSFNISVGGSDYVAVKLPAAGAISDEATLISELRAAVVTALAPVPGQPGTAIDVSTVTAPPPTVGGPETPKWFQISHPTLDVFIRPSLTNDCAVALMLGTSQGGLEVGAFAGARPAPTGTSLLPTGLVAGTGNATRFAGLDPSAVTSVTIDGTTIPFGAGGQTGLQTAAGNPAMYRDASAASPNGNNDGLREKLALIARYVADYAATNPMFPWTVNVRGYRLNITRSDGDDNTIGAPTTFVTWTPANTLHDDNVRFYSLGAGGKNAYQTPGDAGIDGDPPKPSDYAAAYPIVDREVDLFNLLVLPTATGINPAQLWGPASVFCQQRRAMLLMDAPVWPDVLTAQNTIDTLRIGLVKDYSALYFPRLTIQENGQTVQLGPTGAIAGLMARTDSARGVWKAPAGTEADIRGVSGLERRLSDPENGVLNPKAINAVRIFPEGAVCWGARTMDGDDSTPSDYKYVPIRRLSLYIEESLYRGLKWVVFEPNDEPLWGQIRLNVGSFMHGLFTQGAFQGAKSTDAYFVRCDAETTTQDDRNKGIVNIWVGFAPLKPAEFVVLYLQQMAGQIAV
jgi:uncharacterized protein